MLARRAEKGDLPFVQWLIEKGADIDNQDRNGKTALMYALMNDHDDGAKYLIDQGADLDIVSNYDRSALRIAGEKNKKVLMEKLVAHGADANVSNVCGYTLLMRMSAYQANLSAVRFLLAHGADVNAQTDNDKTPLSEALRHKNFEIVKCLVRHGAYIQAEDIAHAKSIGRKGILKWLLKKQKHHNKIQ